MDAFVCEQFGLQTDALGKILFLFVNSVLGDEHNCDHLSHTNLNVAVFSRIVEQVKFMSEGYVLEDVQIVLLLIAKTL